MEDPSGRSQMTRNMLFSWGGHIVFVVSGFIMPRFIDAKMGQAMLGVWDFGWSVVNYFGLASVGIGSSVNRYVAKYRAEGNTAALNVSMSSVMCIQLIAAFIILILTLLATLAVPLLLREGSADYVGEARWVVLFLGSSIAVQVAFDTYGGVMTGCHRWDLHNLINAGFYGAIVTTMIISVAIGGGLRTLALIYLCGVALTEVTRFRVAKAVCPELHIRVRNSDRSEARSMFRFGGKAFVGSLSHRLLYQTNSILVVSFLGTATLAAYSRPMSLVLAVGTFVSKFAYMLTPIASHMDASGNREDLRKFLLRATQYSAYMAVPPILFLSILGSPVLRIWMGRSYDQGLVLLLLSIGHLVSFAHRPLFHVLTGLGAHGRPAIAYLLSAILSVVLCLLFLGPMKLGISGAAVSVSIALLLVDGIYLPIYACGRLEQPAWRYYFSTWSRPLLHAVPLMTFLIIGRLLFQDQPVAAVLFGMATGGIVLGVTYWKWVLPDTEKEKVLKFLGRAGRANPPVLAKEAEK